MLRENLKDSAEILFNILNQPLEITGIRKDISLLQTALNYPMQQDRHSDLSRLLRSFCKNKESTEALIRELDILERELN